MSDYTAVAAQVLQSRYDQSSYWSNTWQNTIRVNDMVQARIASILRPGSIYNEGGRFGYKNIGTFPSGQPRGITELSGMYFRLPTLGWESKTIPYTDYLTPNAWFRTDWRITDLQQAGLSIQYIALVGKARRIYKQIADKLEWIPKNLSNQWDAVMGAGGLPVMRPLSYFRDAGEYPAFLSTEGRRAAWEQIRQGLVSIQQEVSAANLAKLDQEATVLEANTDFWDQVARWSGVDLVQAAFDKLKSKVVEFNKNQGDAEQAIQRTEALMNQTPAAFNTEDHQKLDAIKQRAQEQKAGAKAALDGPVMQALVSDGMQIGIAPVVLIVIGVSVVAGATVTLTTFVVMSETTKRMAIEAEAEALKRRDDFDAQVFTSRTGSIDARIAELQEQLDAGHISKDNYDNQVSALERERNQVQADLMVRRQQTQAQLNDLNQHHKDVLNTGFVSALSNIKGIAMFAALGAVAIVVVPRLLKKKG